MNNTYVKQKLDELHLIDDFLFEVWTEIQQATAETDPWQGGW